ncbi:MAG: GFA family protein, partial [Dongiaceae bacterium]
AIALTTSCIPVFGFDAIRHAGARIGTDEEAIVRARLASCSCGQLRLTCTGEPVRISLCYCLECQRRTGSVFGMQARFPRAQVAAVEGRATQYVRAGDSGEPITFHFCPQPPQDAS